MQDPSDKRNNISSKTAVIKNGSNPKNLARSRRRTAHVKNMRSVLEKSQKQELSKASPPAIMQGYDPEFLYVECGRCGSPVLWEEGRASKLLMEAGVDPLELDASCLLLTDGCPACGSSREYSVRIFRLSDQGATNIIPLHGHA